MIVGLWKFAFTAKGVPIDAGHLARGWHRTVLVGPANIRETVTVDAGGNHYSGTFNLSQFGGAGRPRPALPAPVVVPAVQDHHRSRGYDTYADIGPRRNPNRGDDAARQSRTEAHRNQ